MTKRIERAATWPGPWPTHVGLGTSIEDRQSLSRLVALRSSPAALRFVSFEPLLESLGEIDFAGVGWAIIGGESGPHFRPMDHAWAREIRDQCVARGIPVFFKQSAGLRDGARPYLIEADGSKTEWRQFPRVDRPGQGELFLETPAGPS